MVLGGGGAPPPIPPLRCRTQSLSEYFQRLILLLDGLTKKSRQNYFLYESSRGAIVLLFSLCMLVDLFVHNYFDLIWNR